MKLKVKRVKTPVVLQMEAVECGAASLGIVLAHYGKYIPLEQLREQCDVNRDGSKASNVLKAARKNNLNAKGFRKEPELLAGTAMPAIIHWNFNHFLVLEGIKGNKVYLNDPAAGHRVVSFDEFSQSFTGVILTFEPADNFQKSGKPYSVISAIQQRLNGYRRALAFVVLVGLLLVIPGLVIPVFSRIFVDDILVGNYEEWFTPLIMGMLLTLLLRAGLEWLKVNYLLRARIKFSIATSAQFFWHVLQLPINFFSQRYSGEIGSRVSINNKLASLITGKLAMNFLNVIIIAFYFFIMLQYDVLLTCIGVSLSLLNIIALRLISARRTEEYGKFARAKGKLTGVSMGGLQIIETLKATGRENDFFIQWAGHLTKVLNSEQRLASLSIVLNSIPTFLEALTNLFILVIGALKVMEGQMTMGMLVAFQSLMASFSGPIHRLVSLGGVFQEVKGDMERLEDVLNSKTDPQTDSELPTIQAEKHAVYAHKLEGYVEFRNVTFGYSKLSPPLIENFNLKIEPGQRIALVGDSGSGKSTVAKLLAGIYEIWDGEILIDGKPRSEWPREVINNSLAMVDQDIVLFEGPVRDVITMWDKTIPNNMVVQAAKDAEIHEVITSKRNGYDFKLDEGGRNFSGGQRQRLEIARALVGNPSVLIMDEATSALDPMVEKKVDDNIKKRKCSVLVVAHRLSTIRDSNEIIVMRQGKIVERGTHEELIGLKSDYWELIKK